MLNGNVRSFNPAEGWAFQGDVAIGLIPADIAVSTATEIRPVGGALVLLEGEQTGHHHVIDVMERQESVETVSPSKTSKTVEGILAKAAKATPSSVHFYNDTVAVQELVRRGIMSRADLAIGILVVSGEQGVTVRHHEHDGIRLPAGSYYVGRQIESAFNEERVVRD